MFISYGKLLFRKHWGDLFLGLVLTLSYSEKKLDLDLQNENNALGRLVLS